MARKKTIKLLLINESENEGERLVSVFRNAGRVARAHRASSADDLYSSLGNEQWDLLIANDKHPEISIEQCLEQLGKLDTDLPIIIIRDDSNAAITAM
jgi:DNA-binding NtrC family response regulator